jgi:hypothetical protein
MTKRVWDILILIAGLAFEVLVLLKDKLTGGKNDNRSGSAKA